MDLGIAGLEIALFNQSFPYSNIGLEGLGVMETYLIKYLVT